MSPLLCSISTLWTITGEISELGFMKYSLTNLLPKRGKVDNNNQVWMVARHLIDFLQGLLVSDAICHEHLTTKGGLWYSIYVIRLAPIFLPSK